MSQELTLSLGPARYRIDQDEYNRLIAAQAIRLDDRARRTLYFDGKFLAAKDLVRDQAYELVRHSELGKAVGAGVVEGLRVDLDTDRNRLVIQPGFGLTPAGEVVMIEPEAHEVEVSDLIEIQDLNLRFHLSKQAKDPAHTQTGIYVVVLRPVEFTANPISAYPTTVDGERTVEDGEFIEATAVALVPYPDVASASELKDRRSPLARQIFHEGAEEGMPAQVLPLAVVALLGGTVLWVDVDLARRDSGRPPTDLLGLGTGDRPLREAWVRQYTAHLAQLWKDGEPDQRSIASDHFEVLPPAGTLPKSGLDRTALTQTWFPPEVDVEMALVPKDELPALIEEALILPGLDLQAEAEDLAARSVLILVPVTRREYPALAATLRAAQANGTTSDSEVGANTLDLSGTDASRRVLLSRRVGGFVMRQPADRLLALRLRQPYLSSFRAGLFEPREEETIDTLWRKAIDDAKTEDVKTKFVWYVVRRRVERKVELFGKRLEVLGHEEKRDTEIRAGFAAIDTELATDWDDIVLRASNAARLEMSEFLSGHRAVFDFEILARNYMASVDPVDPTGDPNPKPAIDIDDASRGTSTFGYRELGRGLERLTDLREELKTDDFIKATYDPRHVAALDELALKVDPVRADALGVALAKKVLKANPSERAKALEDVIEEFQEGETTIDELRKGGATIDDDVLKPADGVTTEEALDVLEKAKEKKSLILNLAAIESVRPIRANERPTLGDDVTRETRKEEYEAALQDPDVVGGVQKLEQLEGDDRFFTKRGGAKKLVETGRWAEVGKAITEIEPEKRKDLVTEIEGVLSAGTGDLGKAIDKAIERARGGGPR